MKDVSTESLKDRAITSFVWNFLEKAGSQGIALIIQIVLARLLSPNDFGIMAIMVVFVNIGNVFVQSGLNTAIIQKKDLSELDIDTAFWLSFATASILYCALFFSAPLISSFYSMDALITPLRVLCLIFIFNSIYAIQVAIVTRELDFKRIFKANLIAMLLSGAAGIAIAVLGYGVWGLVTQQVVFSIAGSIAISFETRWFPKLQFSFSEAKALYSFGWKLLASGLIETTYQSLSDLIVGKKYNSSALGYFNQGKKYPMVLGTVLDSTIQPIMLSTVSRVQSDIDKVKGIVRRSLKSSAYVIFPLMVFCAVVAEPLIRFVLGEQWVGSAPYFRAFCIVYALLPIHSTNLQALNGIGHTDIYLKLEILKKVIGTAILLVATFFTSDIKFICYGYILDGLISTFINAFPNKKLIHYSCLEQMKDLAPTIFATLTSALFSLAATVVMDESTIACAAVQFILMLAAYIAQSIIFKNDAFTYLQNELMSRFLKHA